VLCPCPAKVLKELLRVLLFIGDDWAEDHHDLELEDETGRRLAKARLPEGLEGVTRLHELVAQHAPADWAVCRRRRSPAGWSSGSRPTAARG
jgi:hypothetical protein